jgi:lipoprotein NlpI
MTKFFMSLVILLSCHCGLIAQTTKWEVEADTLMSQQKFEEASKRYTKAITTSGLKVKDDYKILFKRAVSYYYAGQFSLALKDLDVFIPQFASIAQAHLLRAFIYGQTEEVEKQLESIERAIELKIDNIDLIKWRGSIQLQKGEFAKAKSDLLKVRDFQDDAELETNLGLAYYSLENSDSAFLCLNKSIEIDATYEAPYLYAGSFCLELEKYELGIKYLNIALLLNAENVNALFYKGIALVELNNAQQGCRLLTKAFNAGQDDAADYLKEHCYEVYK